MKKSRLVLNIFLVICLFILVTPTLAQNDSLRLSLSRDWGYGGFNNDIQGIFTMRAEGSVPLIKVEFFIDGIKVGEATQAPYALQFSTDSYSLGIHTLSATGSTADGKTIQSNQIQAKFVAAAEGPSAAAGMILPILGIVALAALFSVGIPMLVTRGKREELPLGEERKYGLRGGAICPKCRRPFAMHLWGMNLGVSRLDRCPYCGKWSLVRSQALGKLREAEKAELENTSIVEQQELKGNKFDKDLDDTRYM